jgi:hypothetical protein
MWEPTEEIGVLTKAHAVDVPVKEGTRWRRSAAPAARRKARLAKLLGRKTGGICVNLKDRGAPRIKETIA